MLLLSAPEQQQFPDLVLLLSAPEKQLTHKRVLLLSAPVQAQALADAGLPGGFMTWNGVSNLEKYKVIADAWDTVYTQQTPRIQSD